jgi:4-hydroxybutyrate dehydrogenase
MITIHHATRILFGHGAIASLVGECTDLAIRRPLLVSDKGVLGTDAARAVRDALAPLRAAVADEIPSNPTERCVLDALDLYRRHGCDGIVALGGGSVLDAAKAVAILATNPGPLSAYAVSGAVARPIGHDLPPVITIPTTAGTGSEVNRAIGIALGDDGRKSVIMHPRLFAKRAICDPDLTLSLPPAMTAATGADALAHCIEAYLSPVENPPLEAIAKDGMGRLWAHLETCVHDGSDPAARSQVMMGALEGGLAMPKGLGAAHGLGIPLDALHLHHGTLIAVLMPRVLRWYAGHAEAKLHQVKAALGLDRNADLAAELGALNTRIGLPMSLADMGVRPEDAAFAAEAALTGPYHGISVRPCGVAEYRSLLAAAFQRL